MTLDFLEDYISTVDVKKSIRYEWRMWQKTLALTVVDYKKIN